jgi:lipopolysaccharide export system protein LptA
MSFQKSESIRISAPPCAGEGKVLVASVFALIFLMVLPAFAQDTPAPTTETPTVSSGDSPLTITADGTLEWLRDQQLYVARGNAKAVRDDMTVTADVLSAHYETPPGKKSGMQISQLQADGAVELQTPTSQAYGDHGVYDMQTRVMVLTGAALKLVTPEEVVTARDSLEYFQDSDTGVARGNAVAIRGNDRLNADVIAAIFHHDGAADKSAKGDKKGKGAPAEASAKTTTPADSGTAQGGSSDTAKASRLEKLEAKGHVVLVTQTDIVTGDEGVYNPNTDQATVIGNVKVTRGDNQLDGARAEVDMATGISRLFAAPNEKVRGLFTPQKKDKGDTADAGNTSGMVAGKP